MLTLVLKQAGSGLCPTDEYISYPKGQPLLSSSCFSLEESRLSVARFQGCQVKVEIRICKINVLFLCQTTHTHGLDLISLWVQQ